MSNNQASPDMVTLAMAKSYTDSNIVSLVPDFANKKQVASAPGALSLNWTADSDGWVYRYVQVTHPTSNYLAYSALQNGVQRYINTWQGQTSTGTPQNTSTEFWVNKGDTLQFLIDGPLAGQITTNILYFVPAKIWMASE